MITPNPKFLGPHKIIHGVTIASQSKVKTEQHFSGCHSVDEESLGSKTHTSNIIMTVQCNDQNDPMESTNTDKSWEDVIPYYGIYQKMYE
jgi:hypothetical protein